MGGDMRIALAFAVVAAVGMVSARIGDSAQQLVERYGEPIQAGVIKGTAARWWGFRVNDIDVAAYTNLGSCVRMVYFRETEWSNVQGRELAGRNFPGAWVVDAEFSTGQVGWIVYSDRGLKDWAGTVYVDNSMDGGGSRVYVTTPAAADLDRKTAMNELEDL